MQLVEAFSSTCFGNVVGLLSLLIGIIGLFITLFTFNKTKKIEKTIREARVEAINGSQFKKFRMDAINAINRDIKAIRKVGKPTLVAYGTALTYCVKIERYNLLLPKDKEEVQKFHSDISDLIKNNNLDNDGFIIVLEALTSLVTILEKGEYDL